MNRIENERKQQTRKENMWDIDRNMEDVDVHWADISVIRAGLLDWESTEQKEKDKKVC